MVLRKHSLRSVIVINIVVAAILVLLTVAMSNVASVISMSEPLPSGHCIVIDAGHGGVDGGSSTADGTPESMINLEICHRLDALLQLLGYKTLMIRTTDRSMHTQGATIAAQKASDLKERVRIVNQTENPLLISIHQNHFTDSRYSGAQVFYNDNACSKELAQMLQTRFCETLNQGSNRKSKPSSGVYLMSHTECTGILVECGFLSNVSEANKLRANSYQKHLSCVIATGIASFLDQQRSGWYNNITIEKGRCTDG